MTLMEMAPFAQQFMGFFLAFLAGCVGFWLFRLIHFPAPALLGSMAATGLLNILGLFPVFNTTPLSFCCAVLIGFVLGRQINGSVLGRAKTMIRPVIIQITGILLLSLGCGWLLYFLGGGQEGRISLGTAFVSTSAGGLTEMMVFGLSIGADLMMIALVQLFRMITFLSLVPYAPILGKRFEHKPPRPAVENLALPLFSRGEYVLLAAAALGGGTLGYVLHIPAGTLLGAMFGCGITAMLRKKRYTCRPAIRYVAQIGLGLVMGQRISPEFPALLANMFFPALAVTLVMLAGCLLLALIQYATTDYDLTTCLLCSSPAGMSQITIYAEETGADVFTIAVFHTMRVISIVLLYPWIAMHFI